jgi:hypothetical protein
MAVWKRETVTVKRKRWIVASPAHHTDMAQAFAAADKAWQVAKRADPGVGELYVSNEDDVIVMWFEVKVHPDPLETRPA